MTGCAASEREIKPIELTDRQTLPARFDCAQHFARLLRWPGSQPSDQSKWTHKVSSFCVCVSVCFSPCSSLHLSAPPLGSMLGHCCRCWHINGSSRSFWPSSEANRACHLLLPLQLPLQLNQRQLSYELDKYEPSYERLS